MSYGLIYEGASPPDAMPTTDPIREITDEECQQMFTAGRLIDGNYSIIIEDGAVRKYWSPRPDPAPTEPVALNKAQFLDLLSENNGILSDALDNWPEV